MFTKLEDNKQRKPECTLVEKTPRTKPECPPQPLWTQAPEREQVRTEAFRVRRLLGKGQLCLRGAASPCSSPSPITDKNGARLEFGKTTKVPLTQTQVIFKSTYL